MQIDNPEGVEHARPRLARVARQIGLRIPEGAQYVESWSNDAWLCGDIVVRVCFRGDRSRLTREAAIGAALPPEARYPKVLESGADEDLAWMVVARVPGTALWERWKTMPEATLRPIAAQLADILRTLHAWTPPPEVLAALEAHDHAAGDEPRVVTGHDLLPLPYLRWQPLATAARAMPFVDGGMIHALEARLHDLASHDPFSDAARCLVHGDANFANTLEHAGEVTALLDYEWARLGPPDAELVSFVRAAGYWHPRPRPPRPPVVAWLQEDYPELFAAPDVHERVWVTELVYLLRQLVVWPMDRPPAQQPDEHPANTLPALIEAAWEWL